MSRISGITSRQTERIRQLSGQGYSANQIQKTLQQERMGLRRTMLLARVREAKKQPLKRSVEKYVPRKYGGQPPYTGGRPLGSKRVTLTGRHFGRRVAKKAQGSGPQLYNFVMDELTSDFWDDKPTIFS